MEPSNLLDQEDQLANEQKVQRYKRFNRVFLIACAVLATAAYILLFLVTNLQPRDFKSEDSNGMMGFTIAVISGAFFIALGLAGPAAIVALFKVHPIPYRLRFWRWFALVGIGSGTIIISMFLMATLARPV